MSIYTDSHLKKFILKFIILKNLQCDEFISECIYSFLIIQKVLYLQILYTVRDSVTFYFIKNYFILSNFKFLIYMFIIRY